MYLYDVGGKDGNIYDFWIRCQNTGSGICVSGIGNPLSNDKSDRIIFPLEELSNLRVL